MKAIKDQDSPVMGSNKPITCPNCGFEFSYKEAQITEEQRMIEVLHKHGFSLRAIGRAMNNLHPESVKYRLKELERGRKVENHG